LSGSGLCDELITRPEESYRLCCVVVCDLETSRMGAPYIYDISHLRVKMFVTLLAVDKDIVFLISKKNKNLISTCRHAAVLISVSITVFRPGSYRGKNYDPLFSCSFHHRQLFFFFVFALPRHLNSVLIYCT